MKTIERILAALLLIALAVAVIAIVTGPGRAELIDAEPPPFKWTCENNPFPPKESCPVEHQKMIERIMREKPRSKIDDLSDRVDQLEIELERRK